MIAISKKELHHPGDSSGIGWYLYPSGEKFKFIREKLDHMILVEDNKGFQRWFKKEDFIIIEN